MAEIVGRVALSHAPQLLMPPDRWEKLRVELPGSSWQPPVREELARELLPEVKAAKFDRCQAAMVQLQQQIDRWSPDAIILVGDDQKENILDDNTPPLVIYTGEEVDASLKFTHLGAAPSEQMTRYKVHGGLARWVLEHLMDNGFDPAWSLRTRQDFGLGHAFGRPLHFITTGARYPVVPIMLNTYYPPAPSPKRCVQIGEAIAAAVEDYEGAERIVVVGSGGLSHIQIDEELDDHFLNALVKHDLGYMAGMDSRILVGGTSEIRNWIVAASVGETGGHVVDYIPCYRTVTGIGCAMGFAIWD